MYSGRNQPAQYTKQTTENTQRHRRIDVTRVSCCLKATPQMQENGYAFLQCLTCDYLSVAVSAKGGSERRLIYSCVG